MSPPLSSLLGLERSLGTRLITYADDLVILCRRGKAEAALQRLREIMGKLKLTVNEEKTRICKVPEGEFDFLGYTFGRMFSARTGQARIGYRPGAGPIQLQQNQRAAARFTIVLEPDGCPAGFRLRVDHDASFDDWAALSEGAYLLRSNIGDWSDQQLWKAYIQLTQAEAAFRIQKDQLNLRPVWHQREDRVQAHILVCFLAFVLWKSLEMWQQRAGLGNSPRTILEELARIQSHDVVLPTPSCRRARTRPGAASAIPR